MSPPERDATRRVLLAGAGRFSVEVAEIARAAGYEVAGLVEGIDHTRADDDADPPVVWVEEAATFEPEAPLVPAIGSTARRGLVEQLTAGGRPMLTLVHPGAIVSPSAVVEPGCVIFPGVIIAAQVRIGRGAILNRAVLVGHHTTIGTHCTVGPGANIAGSVEVGEQATIAMAAVIRDHIRVGRGATVGAGAVAVADVPDGATVVGVPARPIHRD